MKFQYFSHLKQNEYLMKKLIFSALFLPFLAFSQAPAGYYDGTAGLSGYALKSKVYEIISANNYNWHYGDLPDYYKQTDIDVYYDHTPATNPTGGNYILLDMYSEIPGGADSYEYNTTQIVGAATAEGAVYNREHIVPQNTFYSYYPMYSDLHFVIPTDGYINQRRGNYPYGIAGSTVHYTFSNTSQIANDLTPGYAYTGRVYEPIDEFKGDIARSILYFVTRYEAKLPSFRYEQYANSNTNQIPANDRSPLDGTAERALDAAYINMLKQWNTLDPVSQKEIDRNNTVFAIQKNRNPFIDNMQWVDLIWSETPDAVPPSVPANLTVAQQNAHFVNLSWTASPEADVLGYNIYMDGSATPVARTKSTSISIDRLTPSTTYSFTVKAYDKGYLESAQSNTVNAVTLASDGFAKDLMITKYLEGTGNNKAIEITNNTGHEVNLNNYSLGIQFYNSAGPNYYFDEGYQLEGKAAPGETFVVLNPNASFSCYTNAQARFVTASAPLTFSGYNYVELTYTGNNTVDAIGVKDTDNSLGNQSLYRLPSVTQPTATFDLGEWQVYGSNYCNNLGTLGSADVIYADNKIVIYPNPVSGPELFVDGKDITKVKTVQVFDMSGRLMFSKDNPFRTDNAVDVSALKSGVYMLKIDSKVLRFIKK